jgi:DNA helicase-2/ATP-dependent DNA helicase PcrA
MNTNYLDELNQSQRSAVEYCDGPSLVIAGAGSGKTRVLTYKIAHLLNSGYEPYNILALTFTNKAAREMKARIGRLVGEQRARYLWMGTFHSVFSRILRAEASRIGFTSQFTIYDAADSKSLIRSIIKELGLDEKTYKPGNVQNRISNAKNHLVMPDGYARSREIYEADNNAKMPRIGEIYNIYFERCKQAGAMDFDDLLLYTFVLFNDNPDVRDRYAEQFRYVLVDEYQDTNFAQHRIVLQLTETNRHVCVVGDDAQSIYSFRGADIDNILTFNRSYPEAKLFKLEQNYRSTQTIVSAANSLIDKNQRQIPKNVFSENAEGESIPVIQAYSDIEEGDIVVNKIADMHRRGSGYNDFAILYRTNAQSRIFENALLKRGIPYRIYGGLSFYQRKEVKDVIAYFRMAINPNDEEAFKRIINYPARGIGDTTVGKIQTAAIEGHVSLWSVVCAPEEYGLALNKGTLAKLQGFRGLIEHFIENAAQLDADEIGEQIIRESGIMQDTYSDNSPESLSRRENVEGIANDMKDFCDLRREEGNESISLSDYLSEISLKTDQDSEGDGDGESVTLMTVHSAKGLEFRTVFVVGMEEELFPSSMSVNSPRAVEEERRLFYVAITRAEEHCFLTYAKNRMRYGRPEFCTPSRFLRDIDARYLQLPGSAGVGRRVDAAAQSFRQNNYGSGASSFRGGQSSFGGGQSFGGSQSSFGGSKTSFGGGYSSSSGGSSQSSSFGGSNNGSSVKRQTIIGTPMSERNLKRVSAVTGSSQAPSAGGAEQLRVGQRIAHDRFGEGEVIAVTGTGDNTKATIRFSNAGDKQLLLRFARFKILE